MAAALWGLRPTARGQVEVSARRQVRSQGPVEAHRSRLNGDEVTEADGIPTTTPARTLLDLAAVLPRPQLERAMERAEHLRLADPVSLDLLLQRHRRRRGTGVLRALVDRGVAAAITRSELEDRFLDLVDAHHLPRPEVNVTLPTADALIEVDCLWRAQRLVVELDGRGTHATPSAFERDRARDRALQVAGWRVMRITWRELHRRPPAVANDLRRLLASP